MDRGVVEPAEVLDPCANPDHTAHKARRAASIEIDGATLDAAEAMLDAGRNAVADHYRLSLVSREGPGFLRYGPGGFYRPHCDRAVETDWPDAARRLVSLIVFLNSSRARPDPGEFSGGELVMFPESSDVSGTSEATTVVPRQGALVAFDASMLHEVRPVRGGMRDVIVDWFY
jgi:predicted 2-oxoglutarate/Fe(II)-dependent dioxygenase YbiX